MTETGAIINYNAPHSGEARRMWIGNVLKKLTGFTKYKHPTKDQVW